MDPVTIEKLRAIKSYRRTRFHKTFIQHCITAFVIILCVSIMFPSLCSSMILFFDAFQNIGAFAIGPKCLFLFCNIIVIYLIGGSKIACSTRVAVASPATNIYDEYVKERKGLRELSAFEQKEREMTQIAEEQKEGREELENKIKGKHLHGEAKVGLSSYMLKKRSEEFIARVNRQRRLEAEVLVYSG